MRRAQQTRAAEAYLLGLLPRFQDAAWLHAQIGMTIADYDRERANLHFRRAIELGGHIKTGLELFYDPARNPTNLELLQQAQEIARDVGRPIATHEEARALYNIR